MNQPHGVQGPVVRRAVGMVEQLHPQVARVVVGGVEVSDGP